MSGKARPLRAVFLTGRAVPLRGAVVLLVAASAAAAGEPPPSADPDPATVDTSDWKCTQCPFTQDFSGDAAVGALYADGANAAYGRYTGITHTGTYADAEASGRWRDRDGSYASYDLEDLGLDSRAGRAEGGREGNFDVALTYDGQPSRLYDTGQTPYRAVGSQLSLPADWVSAGSTAGMSALGTSLAPVSIGTERRTVTLLARYFAGPSFTVFGQFQRQEKIGSELGSASFLTDAVQFAQPIHYITDTAEAGVSWAGRGASARLSYSDSKFENDYSALTFANPYLPIVPDATTGRLGVPPGNSLQQVSASGELTLPWSGTLGFAASLGWLRQNDAFLPASTLVSGAPSLGSLDGDVHLSHYAARVALRPAPALSLRGNASYDGRDDKTLPQTVSYIVTDTFPGGTATTPRYGEDRVRLDGGADYTFAHWLRLGVGGKFNDNHYAPGQVIDNLQETESFGRGIVTPIPSLTFTIKAGNGLRKTSSFNPGALPAAENPLVYPYEYAPRDRAFGTLTASWSATSTLTWSAEGTLAKDDYRASTLGLQSVHEQRSSTLLVWTPRETLSIYAGASYEHLSHLQDGYLGAGLTPWMVTETERFWNANVGGRWVPQERWTVSLSYLIAPSYDDVDTAVSGLQQAFPQNFSKLQSTRLDVLYRWTAALEMHVRYIRETLESSDWALAQVAPATVPNLLALGIQPWRDNVNVFGLTVRYRFGPTETAGASP